MLRSEPTDELCSPDPNTQFEIRQQIEKPGVSPPGIDRQRTRGARTTARYPRNGNSGSRALMCSLTCDSTIRRNGSRASVSDRGNRIWDRMSPSTAGPRAGVTHNPQLLALDSVAAPVAARTTQTNPRQDHDDARAGRQRAPRDLEDGTEDRRSIGHNRPSDRRNYRACSWDTDRDSLHPGVDRQSGFRDGDTPHRRGGSIWPRYHRGRHGIRQRQRYGPITAARPSKVSGDRSITRPPMARISATAVP